MKASEALAMVTGLVATFGREAVETELDEIDAGDAKSEVRVATDEAVSQLGDTTEVRAILAVLPSTTVDATEPASGRTRRSSADVALLRAKVLERVKSLGSEVSVGELASQMSEDVSHVSLALRALVASKEIVQKGDKKAARYSAQ